MRVGEFDDGWQEFDITPETLKSFKKNFDDNVRGYPDKKLPMDYYHEAHSKAAGWISNLHLENNETELWADVEWTGPAEKMILEKELRYVSVEFSFEYKDNEDQDEYGPTLFGAGLTNRPFVKGMEPLTFNERKTLKEQKMNLEQSQAKITDLEKTIQSMKTDAEAKDKQLSDAVAKITEFEKKFALSEKENVFNKMLSEGKACEAQRPHFLAGDMVKFAEAHQPINLNGKGKEGQGDGKDGDIKASEKIRKLVNEKMASEKLSYNVAQKKVIGENKELYQEYLKEMGA